MRNKKTEPIRIAQIMGKWVGGGVESVVCKRIFFKERKENEKK